MLSAMLGRKYRGRRKGVAIRAGSVRQARFEAKLSLAQVAAGEISRTAVHHIENDRVKPSLETLRLIARQTRKPIEYFLVAPQGRSGQSEPHQEIVQLERLIAARDFQAVLTLGPTLLNRGWSDEAMAMVHFYVGQAHCRLVQPHEALVHLPPARAQFEQVGLEWLAVDALDWEASARGLLEEPHAVALANEALERCRKLEPRPQQMEARILGHLAGMYVVAHSWTLAISYYEAAVVAASVVKDLLQLAKMHHGLGMAYQHLHQPARARQHLDKAQGLYALESDQSGVYRIEIDLGDLMLQEGLLDSAEQHLLRALGGAEQLGMDRRGRGFILVTLAEVNLRKGNLDLADTYVNQAESAGAAAGERIVLSLVHGLRGRLEENLGDIHAADNHFLQAIDILDGLEMPERLRDCHMEYAQILDERGDVFASARHWRAAAQIRKTNEGSALFANVRNA
jgi:tetratricopeptide (TPR) repeat protein